MKKYKVINNPDNKYAWKIYVQKSMLGFLYWSLIYKTSSYDYFDMWIEKHSDCEIEFEQK